MFTSSSFIRKVCTPTAAGRTQNLVIYKDDPMLCLFLPNVNSSSTNEIEIHRVLSSNLIVLAEI